MSHKMVSPGQFHDQLQLFSTATELRNRLTRSYDAVSMGMTMPQMWAHKVEESKQGYEESWGAHGSGVYESIKRKGFQQEKAPVIHSLGPGDYTVFDAHHRIAAAAAIEEETGKPVWIHHNYRDIDW